MYTFESRIRFSEVDQTGHLTMTALLDYFQDCSTFQSEDCNVGLERLRERGLIWVINSWQIVVSRMPSLGEKVIIGTAPYAFRGFLGMRNFVMETKAGERLAVANSVWSLIRSESLLPERVPNDIMEAYVLEEKLPMDYASRKITVPAESDAKAAGSVIINPHHLDTNHHVNNGQYIRMAMDVLNEVRVTQLRAEYRRQAFLGDTLYPSLYQSQQDQDKKIIVSLDDEHRQPYAIVELTV